MRETERKLKKKEKELVMLLHGKTLIFEYFILKLVKFFSNSECQLEGKLNHMLPPSPYQFFFE
jgi:hypothetical protein